MLRATSEISSDVKVSLINDNRFTGYSRYLQNVEYFFTDKAKEIDSGLGYVFINKEYWNSIDDAEKQRQIANHATRLMLSTYERSYEKDPEAWETAVEDVINQSLKTEGFNLDNFAFDQSLIHI